MEDQELNNEDIEIVTQETDLNESNSVDGSQDEIPTEVAPQEESHQDRNWRAMEKRQKELEFEIQRRDAFLDKVLKSQPNEQPVVEQEPEVPDDDFIPVGSIKKLANKRVKPLEDKLAELEKRLAQQDMSNRLDSLKVKFSDFDDVVNIETLELLEKSEPELAETIAGLQDPYKIGIQSYKYIKALGIADKVPTARRKKEIDKKLEKNAKSVQTPTAYEKRPIAQAMQSTAADKKKIYEEMMYYAGQASGL